MRRRILALAVAAFAACSGTASAEPFVGAGTDPAGDGPTPGRDLIEARVAYDRAAGAISAAVTFAGPIAASDSAQLGIIAHSGTPDECRQSQGGTLFALSGSTAKSSTWFAFGNIDSVFEFGVQPERSADNRTITASYADERLQAYDLRCLDVRLSADSQSLDLITPFWFLGFGPDRDADGVSDNRDRCPDQSGVRELDGCPAPDPAPPRSGLAPLPKQTSPLPPSRVRRGALPGCKVPELVGLSVKRAERRLRGARCRLGRVVQKRTSRRPRVVLLQTVGSGTRAARGTRVDVVLGPKPKAAPKRRS